MLAKQRRVQAGSWTMHQLQRCSLCVSHPHTCLHWRGAHATHSHTVQTYGSPGAGLPCRDWLVRTRAPRTSSSIRHLHRSGCPWRACGLACPAARIQVLIRAADGCMPTVAGGSQVHACGAARAAQHRPGTGPVRTEREPKQPGHARRDFHTVQQHAHGLPSCGSRHTGQLSCKRALASSKRHGPHFWYTKHASRPSLARQTVLMVLPYDTIQATGHHCSPYSHMVGCPKRHRLAANTYLRPSQRLCAANRYLRPPQWSCISQVVCGSPGGGGRASWARRPAGAPRARRPRARRPPATQTPGPSARASAGSALRGSCAPARARGRARARRCRVEQRAAVPAAGPSTERVLPNPGAQAAAKQLLPGARPAHIGSETPPAHTLRHTAAAHDLFLARRTVRVTLRTGTRGR